MSLDFSLYLERAKRRFSSVVQDFNYIEKSHKNNNLSIEQFLDAAKILSEEKFTTMTPDFKEFYDSVSPLLKDILSLGE